MNIIDIEKKCTGCAACVDSCPVKALSLELNKNGFYEPEIQLDKCIHCEKCVTVCTVYSPLSVKDQREYFYGWNKDEQIRAQSSSGGIFSALAEKILNENGVVFGAKYSDDFKSVIMESTENTSLTSLRTSKYVQSKTNGIYNKIKSLLQENRKVLFVGSPCQVAGMRKFFGFNEPNLLLVDFLCGGFPSTTCYSQYISWLEKKYRSKVVSVNFRDKNKTGWAQSGIKVCFENKKTYFSKVDYDPYYHHYYCTPFLKNDACLDCKFKQKRYADITIADFWGFKKMNIKSDDKGLSLIITYNEKGKNFLSAISSSLVLHSIEEQNAAYAFKFNEKSEEELLQREKFLNTVAEKDFIYAAKQNYFKYEKVGVFLRKTKKRLIHMLKGKLRK